MSDDDLFLRTLDDLRERVGKPLDEYGILSLTPLLRKLLLDGTSSLLVRVNRTRRLKITYRFAPFPRPPGFGEEYGGERMIMAGRMGRPIPDPRAARAMTLDQFLATTIMYYDVFQFSVRDILSYMAHIHGGVHISNARKPREKALQEATEMYAQPDPVPTMVGIPMVVAVVLEAMQPLVDAIHAESSGPGGAGGAPSP